MFLSIVNWNIFINKNVQLIGTFYIPYITNSVQKLGSAEQSNNHNNSQSKWSLRETVANVHSSSLHSKQEPPEEVPTKLQLVVLCISVRHTYARQPWDEAGERYVSVWACNGFGDGAEQVWS